ncbi:Uncharacterised protein [Mycobacteroides abscessus subsp. abscessus]|nr:Uncharacterised protein [Mycobacteroides abscessus subsp. abscessus]
MGSDIGDREDLPGFHQDTFGVPEEFGVALGCSLVETVDGSGVAGFFT